MGIFDMFKKKSATLTEEEKLDKMWELWEKGKLKSPCAQLMTYEAEVNNGGHSQYFFNIANCGDLKTEVNTILPILPKILQENLKRGYDAFAAQEDICDDDNEELFKECDDVFYKNEQLLIAVLKTYASELKF